MSQDKNKKSERKEQVLLDIVEEYIKTAHPVSSGELHKNKKYSFSAPTLRNIMAELDERGFLHQPHTSAGRIPTHKGYQFYVDKVSLGAREPVKKHKPKDDLSKIKEEFHRQMQTSTDSAAHMLSRKLADMTNSFAFAGLLNINHIYRDGLKYLLDEPEFISAENIKRLVEYTDSLEERLDNLYNAITDDIRIHIGNYDAEPFSLMAFRSNFPNHEKAVFGILGPMRMDYEANLEALEELKEIFNDF